MKRRSFFALLAAAFASPLIGQLDGLSVPSTGWQPVGITVTWDWEALEPMPLEWESVAKAIAAAWAEDIDKRAADYVYGRFCYDERPCGLCDHPVGAKWKSLIRELIRLWFLKARAPS